MTRRLSFTTRFRHNLEALGLTGTGARVLVAVSGGCDSVSLLHLLAFAAGPGRPRVLAAHFDHAMRPGSRDDARWVAGLCNAWEVPLVTERAETPPRTEAEAREARYAFLLRAKEQAGATHVATAHHADDQAETVLFRVLRGTGIAGLAGIPAADGRGIVRPLLPFWRREIRVYARAQRLRWRTDPSNALADPARNRIRHELLPRVEAHLAPGARRSLVRLAALAAEEERAWRARAEAALAEAVQEREGALLLVRDRFAVYDWPLAARVLRAALRRLGAVPGRTGTRLALEFISRAPSGRELRLPGGVRVTTEFGIARVERAAEGDDPGLPDQPLAIPGAEPGQGAARVGGRALWARWGPEPDATGQAVNIAVERTAFPLTLRGWAPGDRVRTRAGRRPLKKLFGEARVPLRQRRRLPVLADAAGAVLWVPGVASAPECAPGPGERAITLSISDA